MKALISLFLLLMLTLTTPVYADKQVISKQQAVSIALQQHPGRVLSVKHNGNVYRVKILNASGEVRSISVDANSGKTVNR
ncbi:MAG: PepSY domain-containing protein [Gammaproteobacteria bacterium]|nr:PepSY domain-containing protein [Gammaproteobacteria bacterium]